VYGRVGTTTTTDQEAFMRDQMAVMVAFAVLTASSQVFAQAEPAKPAAAAKPAEKAAAPTPPVPPTPAPENDVIKKSAGTWKCEGTVKSAEGEAKYKSTWTIKTVLGGHWHSLVYKRAKMGPMPAFEGNATVGYNGADKKYSFVGFDSMGGWINLSSTDGATFSGEGSPSGKRGPVKFTFTPGKDKKGQESDKLFDVTLDLGIATSQESCKK